MKRRCRKSSSSALLAVVMGFAACTATDARIVINEFMANNATTLTNAQNETSDWIELYNDSATNVNLLGWFLTDNSDKLTKWSFPELTIDAYDYAIVYASDSDESVIGSEVHTDFALNADGEYLALVEPDGETIASAYSPQFPGQIVDVAFGLRPATIDVTLVDTGAVCRLLIPSDGSLGLNWTAVAFDDAGWLSATQGIGYEMTGSNYAGFIQTAVPPQTRGAYMRLPFELRDASDVVSLTMRVRCDDGFAAYLNGVKVEQVNVLGEPAWDSEASSEISNAFAVIAVDFNLSSHTNGLVDGVNVLAIHALNGDSGAADSDMLFEVALVAGVKAVDPDAEWRYFSTPTPGARNVTGLADRTEPVAFNVTRGFYYSAFDLALSTATPGASIYYTLDGQPPSASTGIPYAGPFTISNTVPVRAIALKQNYEPSVSVTHTYIFPSTTISSPLMQKSITEDPRYAPLMTNALLSIPTISLATVTNVVQYDEVETSVEMIFPDASQEGFQINAGYARFGGFWYPVEGGFQKRSFRLYFRSRYGASKLKYPVFDGFDHGVEPVDKFDQLDLRSGSHDMYLRGFYMSGRFVDDTLLEMGHLNTHGRFVHLYINGDYWGQYHLRERWKAGTLAEYLGGSKSDYEAISADNYGGAWRPVLPVDGDGSAWQRVVNLSGDYNALKDYLNVPQYIDFTHLFSMGYAETEFRAAGPTSAGYGYSLQMRDPDGYLRGSGYAVNYTGPANIMGSLRNEGNPDLVILERDRIYRSFFNDGPLTAERNRERLLARCREVETSIIAELARWRGSWGVSHTPETWEAAREAALNRFLTLTDTMIANFRAAGLYPVDAPTFSRAAGTFTNPFTLSMGALHPIYYTIDGSDPREAGTGAIAGSLYASPITIAHATLVKARAKDGAQWSALHEALYVKLGQNPLQISELMYHPRNPDPAETNGTAWTAQDFEFVELWNPSGNTIGLAGLAFTDGITFDFSDGTIPTLAPDAYVLVVNNLDAFARRYTNWATMNIAGEYEGSLNDGGERVTLEDGTGSNVVNFVYEDGQGWSIAADGAGHSLVPIATNAPQ